MINTEDVGRESKDKYGFAVTVSSEALVAMLKEHIITPEGNIERIAVDEERLIVRLYFRGEEPKEGEQGPQCARIGECGEYPERWEYK